MGNCLSFIFGIKNTDEGSELEVAIIEDKLEKIVEDIIYDTLEAQESPENPQTVGTGKKKRPALIIKKGSGSTPGTSTGKPDDSTPSSSKPDADTEAAKGSCSCDKANECPAPDSTAKEANKDIPVLEQIEPAKLQSVPSGDI